jgi:hypothetical protein
MARRTNRTTIDTMLQKYRDAVRDLGGRSRHRFGLEFAAKSPTISLPLQILLSTR